MTTYCVSSVLGAGGNGNGLTWANAALTITAGLALATPTYLQVDAAHAPAAPNAAITWTLPATGIAIVSGTPTGPTSGSAFTPNVAGAVESVGAASAAFILAPVNGTALYMYGIRMNGGTNASGTCSVQIAPTNSVQCTLLLDTPIFDIKAAVATAHLFLGPGQSGASRAVKITLNNPTIIASGSRAGTLVEIGYGVIEFVNMAPTAFQMTGATKPAILFEGGSPGSGINTALDIGLCVFRAGDMSGYAVSGGAYINLSGLTGMSYRFEQVLISGTPTLRTGSWASTSIADITLIDVDSGNTNYEYHYENAYGTMDAENTDYVTTGGAQFSGAPIALKIVTTAAASEYTPFVLPPFREWTTTLTGQTAAVEFAQVNGAAALTDRQVWWDFTYPGSATTPIGAYQTNRSAGPFLTTGVAHATSTNPWTVPNIGASPVTQKLQTGTATTPATFTALVAGMVRAQINVGAASLTMWINPAIDGVANSNNGQTVWEPIGSFTHQAVAGGGGLLVNPGMDGGMH